MFPYILNAKENLATSGLFFFVMLENVCRYVIDKQWKYIFDRNKMCEIVDKKSCDLPLNLKLKWWRIFLILINNKHAF